MSIYKSKTYIADIDQVIDQNVSVLSSFRNTTVLITGASGLICSAVIDIFFRLNERLQYNVDIYLAGRNESKIKERFSKYCDSKFFHYVNYDATRTNCFAFNVDYIIHAASNAYPSLYQKYPVETMLDNFSALNELLVYALKCSVKRLLFISSSEIYGTKQTELPYKENDYGYIDVLSTKASYSISKRAAETLCACFSKEYGVDTVIVRPGHIYGPTASRKDTRVSSQFVFSAADGKDIILKSDGKQIRSYCYMLDSAMAILTVLNRGEIGGAYNISNPNSIISIGKMAEICAQYSNVKLIYNNPSAEEKEKFNPMNNSSLDGDKLISLGWKGQFDAVTGFSHSIKIIKESGI